MEELETLVNEAPVFDEAHDASTVSAHQFFVRVKDWLKKTGSTAREVDEEAAEFGSAALALRTILKFIQSEEVIESISSPVLVTLINPVYKERGRMSRREEHPHGENSLRVKLETFKHFESINPHFASRILVIDDECPEKSGEMANSIIAEYEHSDSKVYFLGDAISNQDDDLPVGLTVKSDSNRSVKGGSVLFGMRKALNYAGDSQHIIIDNDADLSIHPMQIGLVIQDILADNADAVAGSRREADSAALIGEGRNQRGELFINIWQYLLPGLAKTIIDTNRAFKAFDSRALEKILPQIKIYTFPYQIELLQACISNNLRLLKKGIAYIDSEAASTQSGENITETYLNQIHQIIDISRRYKTLPENDLLVEYFLGISESDWAEIEANPPARLTDLYQ